MVNKNTLAYSSIPVDQFYKMTTSCAKAKAQLEKEMKSLTVDLDTVVGDVRHKEGRLAQTMR